MRILIPVVAFVASLPLVARAYKEGPFPNMAGGFGDKTCHSCHLDNPVNAPGGALAISGVPAAYEKGQAYPITVTLTRSGMRRSGFEIAARFAAGTPKGKQAGNWRLTDQRMQLVVSQLDRTLQFVQHTLAGS